MAPAISAGDVIITIPVAPDAVRVGDIISFTSQSGSFVTTHRVIDIERAPDLRFITKGDANRDKDPTPIPAKQVAGKMVLIIPSLGYATRYLRNPLALTILVTVPLAILLWFELDKRWGRRER